MSKLSSVHAHNLKKGADDILQAVHKDRKKEANALKMQADLFLERIETNKANDLSKAHLNIRNEGAKTLREVAEESYQKKIKSMKEAEDKKNKKFSIKKFLLGKGGKKTLKKRKSKRKYK
jgi:hypothetical protein